MALGYAVVNYVLSGGFPDAVVDSIKQQVVVEEPEPEPTGIVRIAGPAFTPATVEFSFNDVWYAITPQVDNDLYWGAYEMKRQLFADPELSEQEHYEDFYNRLTFDPEMDDAIDYVLSQLRPIRDGQGLDGAGYAELIIKYVQSVPYDYVRLEDHQAGIESGKGDPRMPVQTLVDGTGDCDELAVLAAALLAREGYGTALFIFEEEEHAALGLKTEGLGYQASGYEFVEMTNFAYVSEIPADIAGDVEITSTPMILKMGSGSGLYPQSALDEISYIIRARDTALNAAEAKKAYVESTPMSQAQFDIEVALYDACFIAHNSLQATINEDGTSHAENPFKDRIAALQWLAINYWWNY